MRIHFFVNTIYSKFKFKKLELRLNRYFLIEFRKFKWKYMQDRSLDRDTEKRDSILRCSVAYNQIYLIYNYVSLISTFSCVNFHTYQNLFLPRFTTTLLNFDSFISCFIYINLDYRNHQIDISETVVYF